MQISEHNLTEFASWLLAHKTNQLKDKLSSHTPSGADSKLSDGKHDLFSRVLI